jgi:hypothetical protein
MQQAPADPADPFQSLLYIILGGFWINHTNSENRSPMNNRRCYHGKTVLYKAIHDSLLNSIHLIGR